MHMSKDKERRVTISVPGEIVRWLEHKSYFGRSEPDANEWVEALKNHADCRPKGRGLAYRISVSDQAAQLLTDELEAHKHDADSLLRRRISDYVQRIRWKLEDD